VAVSSRTQDLSALAPTGARPRRNEIEPPPELEDAYLVALAKSGSANAYERIVKRYRGFVRLKASSYFLIGGEAEEPVVGKVLGL